MKYILSWLKGFDKKVVLLISLSYTIITAGSLIKLAFLRVVVYGVQNNDWFNIILYYFVVDWTIVVLFMVMVSPFIKKMVLGTTNWFKLIFTHVLISLALGLFVVLFRGIIHYLLDFKSFGEIYNMDSLVEYVNILDLSVLGYLTIVASIYIYYFILKGRNDSIKEAHLITQLNEVKLRMLQSQLQPHFFFNSLNSIASLIEIEPKKAQDTIADLASCMREILNLGKRHLITVREDAEILESYINLLRIRFLEHLDITLQIDSEAGDYAIPPLLIQPLVENAVKHGFKSEGLPLFVEIKVTYLAKMLFITVKNDGNPLMDEFVFSDGPNVGLLNIRQRLNTIYPNAYTFKIQNLPKRSGVYCQIQIPALKAGKQYREYSFPNAID
jgi:Putative regulator of cell autolysis